MRKFLGNVQLFTLTASSQASTKIGANTNSVRVSVGSISSTAGVPGAFIMFGDSTGLTVSSSNGHLLPSPWIDDFDVGPGQTFYCIASSTSALGTLTLTELA